MCFCDRVLVTKGLKIQIKIDLFKVVYYSICKHICSPLESFLYLNDSWVSFKLLNKQPNERKSSQCPKNLMVVLKFESIFLPSLYSRVTEFLQSFTKELCVYIYKK